MTKEKKISVGFEHPACVITIDLRLWCASGIGRYLNAVVPELVRLLPNCRFYLLGSLRVLGEIDWPSNVVLKEFSARLYSIREQLQALWIIPKDTQLLWWPHYNVPLLHRGPLFVTVYDAFHLHLGGSLVNFIKRGYASLLFAVIKRRAERVFTISNFSSNELVSLAKIPIERIRVMHLGVTPEWFISKKEIIKHNRPYIIFVGNVKPHKNLRRVLAAFSDLVDKIPYDFLIVGKRDGFITGDEKVASMAAQLGDRVVFTGWVTDEDLRRYVANARLMIFPSLYEGFGLPPLEAMACGCPVVASDIPAVREVCGDLVRYFDPNSVESIRSSILAEIDTIRDEKKAINWANLYKWENCIMAMRAEFNWQIKRQS